MAEIIAFSALPRARAGKGAARAMRREGRVPAIIYGGNEGAALISIEPRELSRALTRPGFFATLAEVSLEGNVQRVLPREVQLHPVTDAPLHVDFLRVLPGARLNVKVPVVFINEDQSPGIHRGGILNVVRHEIELDTAVDAIPERIVVDLSGLDIGDSVHVSSVTLPPGTQPTIRDRDFTIASIAASSAVREEAAAAATAAPAPAAEPEAAP